MNFAIDNIVAEKQIWMADVYPDFSQEYFKKLIPINTVLVLLISVIVSLFILKVGLIYGSSCDEHYWHIDDILKHIRW